MFRSERTLAGVTLAALVALTGCGKAREDPSQQAVLTPVPAGVSQQATEENANIGRAAPPENEQGGVPEVGSGSGGGSAGAPAPEPDPGMTREEYLALIKRNEDLRADIRATNPKLQLIIDGKFHEFEGLLDKEPRLATVRWGYYEDRPDPLNPFNPPPRGGPNALHLAAEHGALKLVQRLANPESVAPNSGDESALGVAANLEIAKLLVAAGAIISPPDPSDLMESPFRLAAQRGDLALCKWLKERDPDAHLDIEVVNGQHWRPIGFACEAGHLDVVKWFQEQGIPLVLLPGTLSDERGWGIYSLGSSPLARAAAAGQVDVIQYLLANGAKSDLNVQVELKPDQLWREPKKIAYSPALCRAASGGHLEAVQVLLERGAQVNSLGGLNPLHMAALQGRAEVFDFLLEHGAKITTDKYVTRVEEQNGIDLLCCVVRGGDVAAFRRVMETWPQPWLTDEACSDRYDWYRGRGPIAIAVSASHEALVQHMLGRADVAELPQRDAMLNHALATAIETDQVAMLELLRDAGASLDEPLLSPSPGGKNGSQAALARAGAHGSLQALRYLIEQGADINAVDEYGRTVLHQVCRKEFAPRVGLYADLPFRLELIRVSLELGASAKAKDKAGRSLLHDAVERLDAVEIALLLDHGATLMVHDKHGETPAALCERLLAERDARDRRLNLPSGHRTIHSWHERIRLEKIVDLL